MKFGLVIPHHFRFFNQKFYTTKYFRCIGFQNEFREKELHPEIFQKI